MSFVEVVDVHREYWIENFVILQATKKSERGDANREWVMNEGKYLMVHN